MDRDLIAAIDVGKTHTRVGLMDPQAGREVWSARRINQRQQTARGWQLDIEGTERWLIEALHSAPGRNRITALVPVAHGASAVLLDARGEILAAPDYEDPRFEEVNEEYAAQRDTFEHTYSPSLPLGLNLGRQLFYLERREPQLFTQVRHVLTYPQFWAWRLSAVMASEVTSLGCHSDLWRPEKKQFSELAMRRGWNSLFAPLRFAGEALGPAIGPLAQVARLPATCKISCGIHDSNASYLRHLLGRRGERFTVLSSGTWTVIMAGGGDLRRLHEERDMLANVDAFGAAVATARFMGGREYEAIAGTNELPTLQAAREVIGRGAMALPSFAAGGPFQGSSGRLLHVDGLDAAQRAALATIYVALMSALLLDALDARGEIIVDGPLAANPLFAALLAELRPQDTVRIDEGRSAMAAIGCLAGYPHQAEAPLKAASAHGLGLEAYRQTWNIRSSHSRWD